MNIDIGDKKLQTDGDNFWIAPNATIIGDVRLAKDSSIWFDDGSLIGIGSVVLNGAKIGKNCIIGSKALVTEGMIVPDGSMVLGVPGKIKKTLNQEEQSMVSIASNHYVENYKKYKKLLKENENK